MPLTTLIPMFSLLAITLLYASFDIFNKRNVPDVFAYASVVVGLLITFVYNQAYLGYSLLLAIVLGVLGYIVYRVGYWGAGDSLELVSISLIVPVQPMPFFGGVFQLGLPFVISVFIATGVIATLVMPIYYLIFAKKKGGIVPDARHTIYGVSIFLLYMMLLLFLSYVTAFSIIRTLLILLVAVPSALTLAFEEQIASRMAERVYPSSLEEGDIIALRMMSSAEKKYFLRYAGFGRLATKTLIARMRSARKKLPVYKNAAPLAAFILAGVIIALLFGDIVLFII